MKKIIGIVLVLVLVSCSANIEKRRYSKGFYINKSSTIKQNSKKEPIEDYNLSFETRSAKDEVLDQVVNEIPTQQNSETELLINNEIESNEVNTQNFIETNEEECDIITLKDGTEISAKVLTINSTEISYKKCSGSGPTYIVEKSKVFMIKYIDGSKEMFNANKIEKKTSKTTVEKETGKKTNGFATAGFITGLLGLLIGLFAVAILGMLIGVLGIIFSAIALKKIRNNPEKYKGKKLAKAGLIMGIIVTALCLGLIILLAVI